MEPFPFTDSSGRAWHVYDFRVIEQRKRAVPVNDLRAEKRAFVSAPGGDVMIYEFGPVSYHSIEPKLLNDQLRVAKPIDATAGERLNGGHR